MMNRKNFYLLVVIFISVFGQTAFAQKCKIENTAFKAGEKIVYDLYYKYGIVNAKAGTGFIQTSQTAYKGENVYKIYMQANTSGTVKMMYTVNDTLTGYVDKNMRPLLFTKEAREGGDYSKERQVYTYGNSDISIRTMRKRNGADAFDEVVKTEDCAYDYISILSYVRNLDYSEMKEGQNIPIKFISGKKIVDMYIRYLGTSTVKANDGKKYSAIQLSMMILDEAFTNQKEAMRVSLTNDKNRLPIVINTTLKVGSIRVVLKRYENIMYPID